MSRGRGAGPEPGAVPLAPGTPPTVASPALARIPTSLAYYASFIALGLVSGSLGPTLPGLAAQTGSRLAGASMLFSARALGYLGGSWLVGRLYDRLPGHWVMIGSLFTMTGMLLVVPWMPWLWLLGIIILILGAADGTLDVGGNTLLIWVHREKVGPWMNALHLFFGVGAFLSPVIVALTMNSAGDIARAYRVLAILMLPAALWLMRLSTPAMPAPAAGSVGTRVNVRLVALIVGFFFFYTGAEVAFGGWIYAYARALRLGSDAGAAYLTSAFWGCLTVGRLLAIPITLRLPARLVLLGDILGSLASLGVLLLWPHSLTVAWIGTCGIGLCLASIFPGMMCLAQGRMPISGTVTGWFFVGVSGGSMFLPWLIGQFFESVGPRSAMVILTIDLVGALCFLVILAFQAGRPVYRGFVGEG